MAFDFIIAKSDRLPELTATLDDSAGTSFSLAGSTVTFTMKDWEDTIRVNAGACTIVDAAARQVKYVWTAPDTLVPGIYRGRFKVVFGDTREEHFPNDRWFLISVTGG